MATKTITITCQTHGTDIFTARSSSQTRAIAYSKWGTTTFSAYTNNGNIGLASNRFYVSSFFFNKGSNASLWDEIQNAATVNSASLVLTFGSVGNYVTNIFTLGKKTTAAINNWGADSAWKTAKRSAKTDTTITYSLGSGSGSSLFPTTGAFCIGQLNYSGSGGQYPVTKAVLTVVIEVAEDDGGVYFSIDGTIKYCKAYIGVNGTPKLCKAYVGVNGAPMLTKK